MTHLTHNSPDIVQELLFIFLCIYLVALVCCVSAQIFRVVALYKSCALFFPNARQHLGSRVILQNLHFLQGLVFETLWIPFVMPTLICLCDHIKFSSSFGNVKYYFYTLYTYTI